MWVVVTASSRFLGKLEALDRWAAITCRTLSLGGAGLLFWPHQWKGAKPTSTASFVVERIKNNVVGLGVGVELFTAFS